MTITLLTWMGASCVTIPPCWAPRWLVLIRVCLRTRPTPSTRTFCSWGKAAMTRPFAPLSLPDSTRTVSPFLTFIDGAFARLVAAFAFAWPPWSQHLRGERDDPHEALVAQFPTDGAEDARPARVAAVADDDRGVLVEADVGTVRTTALLHRADDDGLDHVTPLDPGTGQRV